MLLLAINVIVLLVANVHHVVLGVHYVCLFFQIFPLLFICNCQWSLHYFLPL
jgi:hypothetical protein